MVERHTFTIDDYAGNTGDVSFAGGHVYANKAPALGWLAAISYLPLHAFEDARGANSGDAWLLTMNAYLCSLLWVALPGSLIPAMLFVYARRRGLDGRWAIVVAMAMALATQLLPYATVLMVPVPSAALLLFAFTSSRRALGGLAAGLAVAMNYLCAPALVLIAITGPRRTWLRYAAGAAGPILALIAYQRFCFGSFFTTSVAVTDPRFLTHGAPLGVLQWPSLRVLYAITFSPYRGFFFFAPVLLIAACGFASWCRAERWSCIAALAVIVLFFAFNASFNGWEGGFGIGGRYLVPVIPLFGLAMLYLPLRLRLVGGLIAAISFTMSFAVVAVDPQPSATIPRPLTQYVMPLLLHGRFQAHVPITPPWSAATFTGHTSVNRLTFDEAVVFSRHAPGSNASEWASFNLGEFFFGAGDVRSLIPIAIILLCGGLVIAKMAGRSAQAP